MVYEYFESEEIIFSLGLFELCFDGLSVGEEGEEKIVEDWERIELCLIFSVGALFVVVI